MAYKGPPKYEDTPLGLDELAHGAQAPSPEDLDGFDVADPGADTRPLAVGDRPAYERIDEMPGAEGLVPFPQVPGCPPETVTPYPYRTPRSDVAQKGNPIFSQWGDRTGGTTGDQLRVETPAQWNNYRLIRSPKLPEGESALWMVDLWAYEVVRTTTAGNPLNPLGSSEIIGRPGGAAPAAQQGNASSRLKARIMWWSSSGGTARVVDIAQGVRCVVEAQLVTVEILYPRPGTVHVSTQGDQLTQKALGELGGTILDTEVGCAIALSSSTPGRQIMTNTMIVEILQGQANLPVFIPPGARDVTVLQSGAGAVATPTFRFGRAAALPLADIGQIVLGAGRQVNTLPRPGAAGMLLTGPADAITDRVLTFIFGMEI